MSRSVVLCLAGLFASLAHGAQVSPVQKVVELLAGCKGKVQADLDAEAKSMGEYVTFCDDELKDKGYAIETAGRSISDLSATAQDAAAQISALGDEISTLGSTIAAKQGELNEAVSVRKGEKADFGAAEKELVTSVDQLGRAASVLKKGLSFAQGSRAQKKSARLSMRLQALWMPNGLTFAPGVLSRAFFRQTRRQRRQQMTTCPSASHRPSRSPTSPQVAGS